jgi:hypothetical protein
MVRNPASKVAWIPKQRTENIDNNRIAKVLTFFAIFFVKLKKSITFAK